MPRGFDLSRHVREHELDSLEAGDRLAELLSVASVGERIVECAFGDAQRLSPDAWPRTIQHRERDFEPRAFFAEPVGGGDLDVVEHKLRGGRTANSQLVLQLRRLPWAGLALEHECRDAFVVGFGVRLGEYDQRAG